MKPFKDLIIFRGGGDVATGSIQKLHRVGYSILVLETPWPNTVRKTVALSECIFKNKVTVEDMTALHCKDLNEIHNAFKQNYIPVIIDPQGEWIWKLKPLAVIDAIIAKKNLGTSRKMAPITIGLGPGFIAGKDVDIVIETNRGHHLGRLIFRGQAEANTHIPGNINGFSKERLLRSPDFGIFHTTKNIGDLVKKGEIIGTVSNQNIISQIDGCLRGLIENQSYVTKNMKIGDVDPRVDVDYHLISDKARNIGGATLEAFLILKNRKKIG
ncbi:MAG: selenium-dependent molybdenum cofactor biosynthesis protein YqeB [Tissierellia bacterium]|nr:selenium-dependent molybdenum cofactor biosynthesis protein YqeB [Tissierellia bacterium]